MNQFMEEREQEQEQEQIVEEGGRWVIKRISQMRQSEEMDGVAYVGGRNRVGKAEFRFRNCFFV